MTTEGLPKIAAVALACGLLVANGCASPLPLNRTWIEVESDHFSVTSDMSVEETANLASTLELFRASVLALTNVRSLESRVPTRVFLFDDVHSFRLFQPQKGILGFLHPTIRANFIAIFDSKHVETKRILRHEFVHFLLRNGSARIYPRWYDEGFAELLSTADVQGEFVEVGAIPRDRLRWLQHGAWIPIRGILDYDGSQRWSDDQITMFYAESWALLHFLARDLAHVKALGSSIETFLARAEAGATTDEACREAFGMGLDDLDREVRRYLDDGPFTLFGVPTRKLQWSEKVRARALSRAEVAEQLGEFALSTGDVATADRLFRAALADEPDRVRSHAGLGDVLKSKRLWPEAEQHFARAVELSPDDPLNQLDLGEYWVTRARTMEDPETRHDLLRRARRHIVRSYELDDSKPEPYAVYGASFLEEGEDPSKGVETLEHARRLLPSSTDIQLVLANAYIRVGRDEDAQPILKRIVAWTHESPGRARARELLNQIDGTSGEAER